MKQREIDTLEKCIEQINGGKPVDECISQFNELKPEMMEILKTTSDLMTIGGYQVSGEQMKQSLIKLLNQAEKLNAKEVKSTSEDQPVSIGQRISKYFREGVLRRPLFNRVALVLGITALLLMLSGGLVITSAKSLPGDSLYPVKRAVEDMTVYLVPIREIRLEYEVNYSQQRVNEVRRLIELRRTQQISFEGVLDKNSSTDWMVGGIRVSIIADTTFVGVLNGIESLVNGSVVEVEGITNPQGGVTAHEIHLRQYPFYGIVEKIDKHSWQVSAIKILITTHTQIGNKIGVGDTVTVLVRSEDDGLYALSIQKEDSPTNLSTTNQIEDDNPTVLLDPTEHGDIVTHEAISSPEVERTVDSEEASHEGLQESGETSTDGEHESNITVGTAENDETEKHGEETDNTPEQHSSSEQTEPQEETP